jgi:hypothetical protein
VHIINDRFQLNLHCTYHKSKDCNVTNFRHPTLILGEIWTKNCFGFMSKLPFITDRVQPHLHCLWRMHSECHVLFFSHPTAMRVDIRTKIFSGSSLKWPSLLTGLNLICTASRGCAMNAICYFSVTAL